MFYPVESDVLPIPFATYDGGTGASITMTGLAVTDIEIYKDGSVTQRASDAGYVLLDTDGIDFDGVTGIHGFSIDLGDNTSAGFYEVGPWYWVVVSAVTVDAQTVNFIAAMFRIVSATRGLAGTALPAAAADAAGGLPVSDAGGLDLDAQVGTDIDAILVDTGTTLQGELDGIQTDTEDIQARLPAALVGGRIDATVDGTGLEAGAAAVIADAVWDEDATGHQTGGTFGQAIGDPAADTNTIYGAVVTGAAGATVAADVIAVKAETATIVADTNELQTDWVNGGRLDLILDIIAADTTTDIPALLATIDTVVDAILLDTAEIGAAGAGLTALASQASVNTIDDFLDTEIAAILEDTGTTLDDMVDDLEARLTSALAVQLTAHGLGVGRGVVDAGSTTTAVVFKSVNGAAADATNDHYNGRHIVFTSGALLLQATSIIDYVGATVTATVAAVTDTPAEDVTFIIV